MLARKSLLIFLNNGVAALLGLVAFFFVGRFMDPAALGMFAFAFSIATLLGSLSRSGLDHAHMKRVSEGTHLGDCVTTHAALRGGVVALAAACLGLGAWAWDRTQGFVDATTLTVVFLMTGHMVLDHGRQMLSATFDGLRHTAKTQFVLLVDNMTRAPLVVLVALLFGASLGRNVPARAMVDDALAALGVTRPLAAADGAELLAVAYLAATAVALLAGVSLFLRHGYPTGRFDRSLARRYLRFALPLAVVALVGSLSLQVDKMMLGFFWSAREVGLYFATQRILSVVLVLPAAVGTLFFPLISELAARNERGGVREIAVTTQRLLSLAMTLFSVGLIAFAPAIFRIFLGEAFVPAAAPLRILAVETLLAGYLTLSGSILMGFERTRALAWIGVVSAGGNILLNLVLIPTSILGVPLAGLGMVGAAAASLVSSAAALGVSFVLVRRTLGQLHVPLAVGKHALAGLLSLAVGLGLTVLPAFGGVDRFYELGAAAAVTAAVYILALWALREWTRKDWLLALELFHPGKMASYIRDELTSRPR